MGARRLTTTGVLVTIVAAVCALAAVALPASSAAGVSAATRMPRASGHLTKVIVLLADRPAGISGRSIARSQLVSSEQSPIATLLRAHGAKDVTVGHAIPYVIARVSAGQRKALASNPLVTAVQADGPLTLAAPSSTGAQAGKPSAKQPDLGASNSPTGTGPSSVCGTAAKPESDPEAVNVINATPANKLGYDGAGVTVAYMAGGIDTTIPDFQRNPAYASSGFSSGGDPVVSSVNFAGDPTADQGGDASVESFLDASSIAAQGNTVYNLDDYISSTHSLPSPCDITVTGAAPGAKVMGLEVFANDYDTTESNFIQAIDYAVANGVKVINESFGSNNFPDTPEDVTRIADDDAVAAGVTVVVSSGDAGVASTLGSPATDPNLISVGASTTFRSYEQDFYGGVNATVPNASNGTWLDNGISSLSSSGFAQNGANTVDLVAPGDLNWDVCSPAAQFGCTNNNGAPSGIDLEGGTSESAPLTAGAAADVIQAYASTHHGNDPSPALVKQILMSTATDIDAPAEQQGAGLLNVLGAVREATSLPGSNAGGQGGLLVSPNQINITQNPGQQTSQRVSVTNTGSSPVRVQLATRTFTDQVGNQTGSFCLNPSSTASPCGAPTTSAFQIWSGITEVYQEETFQVPPTRGASRLSFSADYADTGQASVLHVALYDPSGTYAGYTLPQGLGDYGNVQVTDPKPGTWTAVFFTEQDQTMNGVAQTGTSGTIQWQASTYQSASAGSISPSSLTINPGATASALFTAASSGNSGDTAQSIVLSSSSQATSSIPVTVRTLVPLGYGGGTFSGVLTGGNGRAGEPAQESTYEFQVPPGLNDLDASASFADTGDGVVAYLVDPEGETVASSSNLTLDSAGQSAISTDAVNVYKDDPEAGTWYLRLDWLQPVSGAELAEPFHGAIRFNQVNVGSNLPTRRGQLEQGKTYTFDVFVRNTAQSPETFFLDPRTDQLADVPLVDLFGAGTDQNYALPLPLGAPLPSYVVPTDTREIKTSISGSVPVTYDVEPYPGDPDLSPAVSAPGVTATQSGDSASLDFTPGGEVSPGLWYLNPSEIGPYPGTGAPAATASDSFVAVTPAFDPTVSPSTGDLWSAYQGLSQGFSPVYLEPGQTAVIPLTITPTASPGTWVSGVINVDDAFQDDPVVTTLVDGDELAALPYSYRVGR